MTILEIYQLRLGQYSNFEGVVVMICILGYPVAILLIIKYFLIKYSLTKYSFSEVEPNILLKRTFAFLAIMSLIVILYGIIYNKLDGLFIWSNIFFISSIIYLYVVHFKELLLQAIHVRNRKKELFRYDITKFEGDKTHQLFKYLIKNQSDSTESWTYGHEPTIIAHLNNFSKEDSDKLNVEMWNWGTEKLFNLADPIIETDNVYIDCYLIYFKIFLQINDIDIEESFINNIYLIENIPLGNQTIEFYNSIKTKLVAFKGNEENNNWYLNIIDKKIKEETNFCRNK